MLPPDAARRMHAVRAEEDATLSDTAFPRLFRFFAGIMLGVESLFGRRMSVSVIKTKVAMQQCCARFGLASAEANRD